MSSAAKKEVRLAIFSHQAYMNSCQVEPITAAYPKTRVVPVRLSPETAALAADCNAVGAHWCVDAVTRLDARRCARS